MESRIYFAKTKEMKSMSESAPEDDVIYPQDWAEADHKSKPRILINYRELDYKQALADLAHQSLA